MGVHLNTGGPGEGADPWTPANDPFGLGIVNPVVGPQVVYDVRQYGRVDPTGATSSFAAFQACITAALAANPTSLATGQVTNRTVTVQVPAGDFLIDGNLLADLTVPSTSSTDRKRLHIVGQGENQTAIFCDPSVTGTILKVWGGSVTLEGMTFHGRSTFTGTMVELGVQSGSDYVNQGQFSRVSFRQLGAGGKGLKIVWAFDMSFIDCSWFGMKSGAVGLDVPVNTTDNSNNMVFVRCHWETALDGAMIKVRSDFSSTGYHTGWSFTDCHFEPRSWKCACIDAEGVSRWSFLGGSFPQGNTNGTLSGVVAADAVSPLRFVNANAIQFLATGLTRQGTASAFPTYLISLGGNIRGFEFRNAYFSTNDLVSVPGVTGLWQSDVAVPLNSPTGLVLQIPGCTINQFSNLEQGATDVLIADSTAGTSNWWRLKLNAATKYMDFRYGTSATDLSGDQGRLRVYKDGGISAAGGYFAGRQVTSLANNASTTFTIGYDANANKVGIFQVYSTFPGATSAAAIFFFNGTNIFPIWVGTAASVALVDPGTAGLLSIYMSGVDIAVTNRTGSSLSKVSLVPFGLTA